MNQTPGQVQKTCNFRVQIPTFVKRFSDFKIEIKSNMHVNAKLLKKIKNVKVLDNQIKNCRNIIVAMTNLNFFVQEMNGFIRECYFQDRNFCPKIYQSRN